jgi:aryl-alcohol dehydrogenase-like predicted oxidoreductase
MLMAGDSRANRGWIDLYQAHRPDPDTAVEETLSALTDLQRQGKIRAFGSSTFPAHETVEAQWTARDRTLGRFVTEQPPYSILVRGIEADLLPVAQRYGMGVLPWSPLAGGWLTGRYRKGHPSPTSLRAERLPARYDLSDPDNQRKLETAEALAVVAQNAGLSLIPHGAGLRAGAPRGDRTDHRTAHDGTARITTRCP